MIKLLCKYEFAHLIDKGLLAHTVRHLCNYDVEATILALFNICHRTNRYGTTASFVSLYHRCTTVNFSPSWEIWTFDVLH